MSNRLQILLALSVLAAAGCDRQQSAKPAAASTQRSEPAPPVKKPSEGAAATAAPAPKKGAPSMQNPSAPVQPAAPELKVELGESEQRPILFFGLRAGWTVQISKLKYDSLGWVDSYEASFQTDKGGRGDVFVQTVTTAGGGRAPIHSAMVNGKPVPKQSDKKLVGFAIKGADGVVLAARSGVPVAINGKTTLSYDPSGRMQIAQQEFEHEGKNFSIAYSDYRWNANGRLEGYTAQVQRAD